LLDALLDVFVSSGSDESFAKNKYEKSCYYEVTF